MTLPPDRRQSMLTRILQVIRERTGLHEQFAKPVAETVLSELESEFQGQQVYFGEDREADYSRALAEFTGNNRDAVCAKFKISKATFYRILNRGKPARTDPQKPAPRGGNDFSL